MIFSSPKDPEKEYYKKKNTSPDLPIEET